VKFSAFYGIRSFITAFTGRNDIGRFDRGQIKTDMLKFAWRDQDKLRNLQL